MEKAFYSPKNIVATFEDEYGEVRTIHRPKGKALRMAKNVNTPALRMNRVAAVLIGRRIKVMREKRGLSLESLATLAGLASQTPKQYMWGIENAKRNEGVRVGTLFALAFALECEVSDFLPTVAEVADEASVAIRTTRRAA